MDRHNSILVIDDEVDFTHLMSEILQRSNYDVDNAADGLEGLEKMMSHTYDLIMLDLIMPNSNGLDILEKIKENDPSLPVCPANRIRRRSGQDRSLPSRAWIITWVS